MSEKKGIASNNSFDKMPNTFSGSALMNCGANQPIWMAMKPDSKPSADKENATGKPISMIKISPANISGAKVSMLIAAVFRSERRGRICLAAKPLV